MAVKKDLRLAGIVYLKDDETVRIYEDSDGFLYEGFSNKRASDALLNTWRSKLASDGHLNKEYRISESVPAHGKYMWACQLIIYDPYRREKACIFGYSVDFPDKALKDVMDKYNALLDIPNVDDSKGFEIDRCRWVIMRNNRTEIFCGLSRNYDFRSLDELKDAPVKTYLSEKKALAAFKNSWYKIDFEFEAVPVMEIFQQIVEV